MSDRTAALKAAVESLHGGSASFVESVPITERSGSEIVWTGTVYVFDLTGHPTATRAYAWAELMDAESGRQRFHAVLREGPVDSPQKAVQAVVMRDYKENHPEDR